MGKENQLCGTNENKRIYSFNPSCFSNDLSPGVRNSVVDKTKGILQYNITWFPRIVYLDDTWVSWCEEDVNVYYCRRWSVIEKKFVIKYFTHSTFPHSQYKQCYCSAM